MPDPNARGDKALEANTRALNANTKAIEEQNKLLKKLTSPVRFTNHPYLKPSEGEPHELETEGSNALE